MSQALTQNDYDTEQFAVELRRKHDAVTTMEGFTRFTFPSYEFNWHHIRICDFVDKFLSGEIKRGMIFMPPRHGKSELATKRMPALALGRNRDEQIIMASYSADLASKFNRECQRVIDDPRYQMLFPNTKLPGMAGVPFSKKVRTSELFEVAGDARGYYRSAGVGGGITGMGFTIGVIDDPFKDRQEANSESTRERVWDWYTSTFMSRMEKSARILIIMTRWHEDDLCGRLLSLAEDDPKADQWDVLCFPAVREEGEAPYDLRQPGEALWPDKKSRADLDKIRRASTRDWNSIWQQTPVTEGGNMFKSHWWRWYERMPSKFDQIILSVDAAFKDTKKSDYVVVQCWGRIGADKYLLDQFRDKMDIIQTMKAIANMVGKWPKVRHKLVEDKANGPAVIQMLKGKISGIIAINPEGSKESRAHACIDQVESGNVYLPVKALAPWIDDYTDELAKFPRGKNDDQVDATTQALIWLKEREARGTRALATQ